MATVYSDYYTTGTYTKTRVRVDYSGTSATATLLYTRTNNYQQATWQIGTFTFGGASVSFDKTFYGVQSDAIVASVSFTISSSGGTYSGTATSTGEAHFMDFSGSVYIPSQGSAPSQGHIDSPSSYWDATNQAIVIYSPNVGCNDGGLALTADHFKVATIPYTDSGFPDPSTQATFYIANNSAVWATDSNRAEGSLSIIGNKFYYLGLYAQNNAGFYRYKTADGAPSIVTVPPEAQVTLGTTSATQQEISATFPADDGYYAKDFYYRLNGGAWTQLDTITGGGQVTRTYTITGLADGAAYTLETKVETLAGATVCSAPLAFITPVGKDFYGSVSNAATHINKLYGSSGGTTVQIHKLYGSVNGVAKPIFIRHVHE